jgi:hypothetical protein
MWGTIPVGEVRGGGGPPTRPPGAGTNPFPTPVDGSMVVVMMLSEELHMYMYTVHMYI